MNDGTMYRVTRIRWDVDEDANGIELPTTLAVFVPGDAEPEEYLRDKISDIVGFCHDGFELEPTPDRTPPGRIPSYTGLTGSEHDQVDRWGRDFPCFYFWSDRADDSLVVFDGWSEQAYQALEKGEWDDWVNIRARSEDEARANYESAFEQWRDDENAA